MFHASIASFLPDGDERQASRLRLSEVSRTLFESYGGSLTKIWLSYVDDSSNARLVALLRRQPLLAEVTLNYEMTPDGLSNLARALMGGTAPQLQDLGMGGIGSFNKGYDMVIIADMLEARASIPGCARFKSLRVGNYRWFDDASLETQIRLLRVLLPSIERLPDLSWKRGFVDCFCEVQAPFLTDLELSPDGGSDFSWKMLEAAPALMSIVFTDDCNGGTSVFKSVSTALRG